MNSRPDWSKFPTRSKFTIEIVHTDGEIYRVRNVSLTRDGWFEIVEDGGNLIRRINLEPGERRALEASPRSARFRLTLGRDVVLEQ